MFALKGPDPAQLQFTEKKWSSVQATTRLNLLRVTGTQFSVAPIWKYCYRFFYETFLKFVVFIPKEFLEIDISARIFYI